ncbi:MAG: alpha/beta fold hydrolase, partial [Gaiellales bacterium]
MVCLHGLGLGPSDWDAVRGPLERFGRVSTPALPRHPDRAFAAAARAVQPEAVVIGHSMGGVIALRVSAETSRPLRGIVLTGCAFPVARNGRSRRATAADYAGNRLAFVR